MKRRHLFLNVLTASVLFGGISAAPAFACESCANGMSKNEDGLIFDANLRGRYEYMGFGDLPGSDLDDDYSFSSVKGQTGVGYRWRGVTAYLQGQYSQLFTLPNDSLGIGNDYFVHNDFDRRPGDVFIRQGYLRFDALEKNHGLDATVGRFLYSSGMEVKKHGNETVDWLKKNRVAERLIGSADFYLGRSFEGMGTNFRFEECLGTFSANLMHPSQGVFETDGFVPIRDLDLITGAYTSSADGWPGEGEFQAFYYYYDDGRDENIFKTDNRVGLSDAENVQVSTYGVHWVQAYPMSEGVTFDSVTWGALQGGSWGLQDHLALAFALEGGVRFNDAWSKPWLRAGWNWSSGDDDSSDSDHGTFFQMLPEARRYAKNPFYNQMNNQDLFVQGIMEPFEKASFTTTVHQLWLTESEDLLYSGSGASRRVDQFGFNGVSGGGATSIGTLLDLEFAVDIMDNVGLSLYYGHLFGDSVAESAFSDGDIDYGFAELNFKL